METEQHGERMKSLLDAFNMNAKSFAESIGLDRADRIYYILNNRNGISKDMAELIVKRYNMISYRWLLTGDGQMFVSSESINGANVVLEVLAEKHINPFQLAEMIGMQFAAEITDAIRGVPPSESLLKRIRTLKKKKGVPFLHHGQIIGTIQDSVENYKGDYYFIPSSEIECIIITPSELDDIKKGDALAIRKVVDVPCIANRVYLLDTKSGLLLCNILSDVYRVRCNNGEFDVPREQVNQVYLVVDFIRSV